jgi:hypothetical protein
MLLPGSGPPHTGDAKYGDAAETLKTKHAYGTNAMVTKIQRGIGSGNQSDDEMANMVTTTSSSTRTTPNCGRR